MKKLFLTLFVVTFLTYVHAQDTFSICAVDTVTGEVGSAGASCIDGSIIISDIHPGVGVIHTQAFYLPGNQNLGRTLMDAGLEPDSIIAGLLAGDVAGNPAWRQYGVVDLFDGGARSSGFTGTSAMNWKGHLLGPNYAIQGNILLGPEILDSMEARFNREDGPLCDKLMAALQGANVSGADTRCYAEGTSSKSAFIRVARPEDTTGTYWLDLNVNDTPLAVEPIDELQELFDAAKGVAGIGDRYRNKGFRLFPNPATDLVRVQVTRSELLTEGLEANLSNMNGQSIRKIKIENRKYGEFRTSDLPKGMYLVHITSGGESLGVEKLLLQ